VLLLVDLVLLLRLHLVDLAVLHLAQNLAQQEAHLLLFQFLLEQL